MTRGVLIDVAALKGSVVNMNALRRQSSRPWCPASET